MEFTLSEESKKKLIEIARYAIENALLLRKVNVSKPPLEELNIKGLGVFVTLKNKENLRGCIGCFSSEKTLWETVSEYSLESLNDSRFLNNPITKDELSNINIEISVLSPYKKIKSYEDAELGKHGIIVEKGYRRGVFLPQVAIETGWDKKKFFSMCALHKAGLHEEAYLDKDVNLYTFEALIINEEENY